MKLTKTLEGFKKEIEAGNYNTPILRKVVATTLQKDWSMALISDALGVEIIYCDICGEASFAHKTISAYHGAYWACEDCTPLFWPCKPCGTYVLQTDLNNPTHVHASFEIPGQVYFPDQENNIAVYNADVMDGVGGKGFLRSLDEITSAHTAMSLGKKATPLRYFGIELEVEKVPGVPPDIAARTITTLGNKFVMLKHDGSLSRHGKNGFEIVTKPATMQYHKGGIWDAFYEHLADFFEEAPATTGLHVHVGTSTVLPITIGRMLMFINADKNREFVCDISGRQLDVPNPNGRIYAGVKDNWKASDLMRLRQHAADCPWNPRNKAANNRYALDAIGRIKFDPYGNAIIATLTGTQSPVRATCKCQPGLYNLQKYDALNVMTKRATVEFRIFRGVVKQTFLYMALEFADALVDFCADTAMSGLTYQNFVEWIVRGRRKIYPNLYRHLVNLGWIDPPKSYPELETSATPYGKV